MGNNMTLLGRSIRPLTLAHACGYARHPLCHVLNHALPTSCRVAEIHPTLLASKGCLSILAHITKQPFLGLHGYVPMKGL
jgi:hypothetical protein